MERFGAHGRAEYIAELALVFAILVLVQKGHLHQLLKLLAVGLGLLTQTDEPLVHAIAQIIAGRADLALQFANLAIEFIQFLLLLVFEHLLGRLQAFLGDLLHLHDVFATNFLALLDE